MYGIKTGYNDAFVIDGATRERLIREDARSEEIIKPYLRGQDIDRWAADWAEQWMIVLASSSDHPWPWAIETDAEAAERVFAAAFPAIARHFAPHRAALMARYDKGRFFWELRSCAYYAEFARPKLIYQVIQYHPLYALDRSAALSNDKTFFVPIDDPWLLACLNSTLMWWHNWRHLSHLKDEALNTLGYLIEAVPIAPSSPHAEPAAAAVAALCAIQDEAHAARRLLASWYRGEWGVEKLPNALRDPFALDAAAFAAALRGALPRGRRRLSAAETAHICREHAASVAPVARRLAEAAALELRLDAMVNAAYGLTPEDVALLWRTAPPRMPLPPPPG